MVTALYSLVILLVFYLFVLLPGRRSVPKAFYSHRGHHLKDQSIPENSLRAFQRSIDHGYGIELDLQLSKDGIVYVFHDDRLKRLLKDDRAFASLSSEEIDQIDLYGEKIPRFTEVLALVDGQVPLIVELKSNDRYRELSEKAVQALKKYDGDYVIESFDPRIVTYFRFHYPHIVRGFLLMDPEKYKKPKAAYMLSSLIFNFLMRADFIAIEKRYYAKHWPSRIFKALGGELVLWTIHKNDKIEEDIIIFEYFEPRGL